MEVTIPVLADYVSINDIYKEFETMIGSLSTSNKAYKPELRVMACILEVCAKNAIQNRNEQEIKQLIEIAMDGCNLLKQ